MEVRIAYKTDEGCFDFHATRHAGITRGVGAMEPPQLQKFARHSKREMTMRGVHTADEPLREEADRLAVIAPPVPTSTKPVDLRTKNGPRPAHDQ